MILGQTIHKQEILALETLFGESFPDKDGVLVYRFSSNGKDVEHKVITNSNAMDIAGIHADGDLIIFGGDIHIKKFTEANHTYERDLIFFKFDISTGAVLANKVIAKLFETGQRKLLSPMLGRTEKKQTQDNLANIYNKIKEQKCPLP